MVSTSEALAGRELFPDGERDQAAVRLRGGVLFLFANAMLAQFGFIAEVEAALPATIAYVLFGLCCYGVIRRGWLQPPQRRALTILFDHGIIAIGLWCGGPVLALVVWAPTFATIGYGLRFGKAWAIASMCVSTPLMVLSMSLSSYWQANFFNALGIIAGNVVLPVYAIRLSQYLEIGRERAEMLAATYQAISRLDGLTGVLNRKAFEEELEGCVLRGEAGYVVYIDLDNFKIINDNGGHAAGDALLRDTAALIKASIRGKDLVARIGGDEFAVLLRGVGDERCREIGQKLVSGFHALPVSASIAVAPSASIGMCAFDERVVTSAVQLLASADACMYLAKRAGKNRVCLAGELLPAVAV